ncbi:MAG TPA: ThuA domain-containing protein [bacterium]|nr:ThuA domain-containing protein [bacterium]HPP29828.1 ThuA domain-containing protein [bacterium]
MKKILYVYGGPEFHPTEWAGQQLKGMLDGDGRFRMDMTSDLDAFASLPSSGYDAVVVYTTGFKDDLTPEREKGLLQFVRNGGGFVGIHSATDSFRGSRRYIEMINGEFLTHPEHHEFSVSVVDKQHYITVRMPDSFSLYDEMYHLQNYDPSRSNLLFKTVWQGKEIPVGYARDYGKGKVVYISLGHTKESWNNFEFQKILVRAIAYSAGYQLTDKVIRCGILGYGPAFNMGKLHTGWIDAVPGLKTVAVCDANPARVEAAKQELPELKGYFTDLSDMLKMKELDLVVVILPHNLHAPAVLQCLDAGKNVVVEKPFCITVEEADAMIEKASSSGLMLSVFHNRRWDPDYILIREIVNRGVIGSVFHIECGFSSYVHPGFWWRSDKNVSGGVLYDWGAHFLDWVLNLVNSKVISITGELKKLVWNAVTNEDYGEIYIRFENGVTVDFVISNISAVPRPKWRILGTKGAIEQTKGDEITLVSYVSGIRQEGRVAVPKGSLDNWRQYYRNIADHLLMGEELLVKPEQARRVIAVLEECEKASKEKGILSI